LIFWYIVNRRALHLEFDDYDVEVKINVYVRNTGIEVVIETGRFDCQDVDHFTGFCSNSFVYSIFGEEVIRDAFYQRIRLFMIR